MKAVVVIDDDDVREVIVFALESEGFEVDAYPNGKLALEGLLRRPHEELPGLMIIDYLMPEMDGVTLIKEICSNHTNLLGNVPLALSTAMGEVNLDIECENELIHLHKPMDLDNLLKTVRKFCS